MKLKLWPITGAGYLYAGTSEFVRQISKYMRWCKNNNSNPVLDLYPEGYNLHVGGAYKSIVHIADAVGFKESEITLVTGDMAAVYGCNVIKHEPFFMDKASDYCLMHPTEFLKNKDKFSEDDLKPLNEAIAASKKVLENQEASSDDLKKSLDELTQASHAFSSKLYEQQKASGEASAEAGSTGGAEAKSGDDDVIDADYKDVN